ncbi:MAG: hypothetical protein RIR45_2010 [Pseudomonadota bacterium]
MFHSLVVSFASFLLWFWLLRKYLASRLGEPIEPSFLLGAVPVLVGIVLVSGGEWLTQLVCAGRRAAWHFAAFVSSALRAPLLPHCAKRHTALSPGP